MSGEREDRLPIVEPALIEWLESKYKNQVPDAGDSDRDIWVHVGAVRVVRALRKIMEAQNENVLEESVLDERDR
jgi:hypothetical protein